MNHFGINSKTFIYLDKYINALPFLGSGETGKYVLGDMHKNS